MSHRLSVAVVRRAAHHGVHPVTPRLVLHVAAAFLLAGALSAQTRTSQRAGVAPDRNRHAPSDSAARVTALRVARDIMRVTRFCALITRDVTTGTAARTIDPAPPDSAMVVRFVTNPRSRKVRQLAADPRVALYYFDATAQRYATLYGRARRIADPAEVGRRWHEGWTPFYPDRERGATLYEVIPDRLEVVSPGEGVVGDSVTWATPTVKFTPAVPRR